MNERLMKFLTFANWQGYDLTPYQLEVISPLFDMPTGSGHSTLMRLLAEYPKAESYYFKKRPTVARALKTRHA